MKRIVRHKFTVEERWLRAHFSKLIESHAGKYVVVAGSEGFIGDLQKSLTEAQKKYPTATPLIMKIPREKDFLHVLI